MRVFNFSLTIAAALVAILVLTNIGLGRHNASVAGQLTSAQQVLQSLPSNRQALGALVERVNSAAATDQPLKDLLKRLQLSVTNS
ncbi:MAG: hypothetical protein PW734_06405 [Verrucomicrobium sp.]|nr:hypothetical protein [Verrucomicrobium sp.]